MTTQRGFTLVELILVIVVIGILAAVVGPRFFERNVFDERLYFEETLAAVRYAQKVAVASGCSIKVEVDSVGYRLTYAKDCGNGLKHPNVGDPVADPSGGQYRGENTHRVTIDPELTVIFDSLGAASPAASTRFADGAFTLTVHSTGFIEAHP